MIFEIFIFVSGGDYAMPLHVFTAINVLIIVFINGRRQLEMQ